MATLLCNRERVGDVGLCFDDGDADGDASDVFLGGECDDGARELARFAGMDVR